MKTVFYSAIRIGGVGILLLALLTMFWGLPVPRQPCCQGAARIVGGQLTPENMLLPREEIANKELVDKVMEFIAKSPQRLAMGTFGILKGAAVILDANDEPIAALFYQREHKGMVVYDVEKADHGYQIQGERNLLNGAFVRVYGCDAFEIMRGLWRKLPDKGVDEGAGEGQPEVPLKP
ncbi:MAG: hypothetical protein D6766_08895 [Verrucomicrobia bacterium]|nr:MAG: hypothetical protein D6766_08895 [Verrucomicrobiota bacterium]